MTQRTRHQNCLAALRIVTPPFYPYLTKGGVVYGEPVTDYDADNHCRECPHQAECLEGVLAGGYALCEQVIAAEVLPRAIVEKMMEVFNVCG